MIQSPFSFCDLSLRIINREMIERMKLKIRIEIAKTGLIKIEFIRIYFCHPLLIYP